MGRVRLRVRDIDYADEIKPMKPILSSPAKSPKKPTSATKLKASKADAKSGGASARG